VDNLRKKQIPRLFVFNGLGGVVRKRRRDFKDRWEDGYGTGPPRSTAASLKIRRGRASLSGETSAVSGIKQMGVVVRQIQCSEETKVTRGPSMWGYVAAL